MRSFSLAVAAVAGMALLGPSGTYAQSTKAAAPTEISPSKPLADLPRNQQLILGWSIASPIGVTNPWAVPGYTHQEGNVLMWEPLMYFGIFADKYIPWLATSMEYTNKDFTTLEIKLNPKAAWSDGQPVTAKDVVFTFEGQMKNEKLPYHASFEQFVDKVTAVDDQTVDVKFKIPAPRFKFEVLTREVRHRHSDRARARARQADRTSMPTPAAPKSRTPAPMTSSPGTPTRRSTTCVPTGGRSRPA